MTRKYQTRTPLNKYLETISKISETDWIRLAAFIDGEGTILINRSEPTGRMKSPAHVLCVNIGNSSPVLIQWLFSCFGGSIQPRKEKPEIAEHRRPFWNWCLREAQAEAVLRRCLPYFIIKREQAEIGLAFRNLKNLGTQKFTRVTAEQLQQREAMYQKIHLLNSSVISNKGQEVEKKGA
jgi:hypothetical protein